MARSLKVTRATGKAKERNVTPVGKKATSQQIAGRRVTGRDTAKIIKGGKAKGQ